MANENTVENLGQLEDEMIGDEGDEFTDQLDYSDVDDDEPEQLDEHDGYDVEDNKDYVDEQDEDDSEDDDSEDDSDDQAEDDSEQDDEQSEDDPNLFTVKVNGEEQQVELDELKRAYSSKGESARLAQEAQQIRKQSENLIQQLKNDPISILKDERLLGADNLRTMVEDWLVEQYQYENMSDEEREAYENKQKIRQYEEEKRLQEQEQMEQLTQQYQNQMQNDISSAIENSDVPQSDYAFHRVVQYLRQGTENGVALNPQDVMPWVEKDYQQDLQQMISKRDPEKLVEVFGQEALDNLRKADADKIKGKSNNNKSNKKKHHIGNKSSKSKSSKDDGDTINSLNDIFGKPGFDS